MLRRRESPESRDRGISDLFSRVNSHFPIIRFYLPLVSSILNYRSLLLRLYGEFKPTVYFDETTRRQPATYDIYLWLFMEAGSTPLAWIDESQRRGAVWIRRSFFRRRIPNDRDDG